MKDVGSVHNPEYGVDITVGIPKIADYGNIQITATMNAQQFMIKPTITELYAKLATKVGLCLNRGFIPFVIGGSRDLF